ncbi:MAG: DUF1330 domain-containing protein [Aliishimia sp.]
MDYFRLEAKLWVRNGRFKDFTDFETAAFKIMALHGGKVLDVQKNHSATDNKPHEIHVLEFPTLAAFEAYKTDPALLKLAQLREKCIAKTEVNTLHR